MVRPDSCIIWHFTHLFPCCLFTFSVRFGVCFCLGSKPTNFDATYKCPWHMDQIAPRVCIHINHHPDRWTQQPFQWIELPPFCPRHFLSSAFLVFMLYKEERKNTGLHSITWKRIIYNFRRKVGVLLAEDCVRCIKFYSNRNSFQFHFVIRNSVDASKLRHGSIESMKKNKSE